MPLGVFFFCNFTVYFGSREGLVTFRFILKLGKLSYKGHDLLRTITKIMANIW